MLTARTASGIKSFGPIPDGYKATKIRVQGSVPNGAAQAIVQMAAAHMTAPPVNPGDVNLAPNKIMPYGQMFLAYNPVAGNTAPGPTLNLEIPCEMPVDPAEVYVGVEFPYIANFSGCLSVEIAKV